MDPTRVILVDDHTMFREGLVAILSSRQGIEVVGHFPTGVGTLTHLRAQRPDVVVIQIDGDPGVDKGIVASIREASPRSRIVALTVFEGLRYVKALSEAGIDAYVHKSSSSDELVATIVALARDPQGSDMVVSVPRSSLERLGDGTMGGLSQRETEIVVYAARGLSNRQIADELHLAEATVKRHLANVYLKVGASSRTEVVRMALAEQWIGLGEIIREAPSPDGHLVGSEAGVTEG